MADSPLGPTSRRPANVPRGADAPGLVTPVEPFTALSSERYLAWLYSPQERQPVLTALCQIEAEVASSLRQGIEHHVAHARLQWWREECERAEHGRPAHPLTRELVRALGRAAPPSTAGRDVAARVASSATGSKAVVGIAPPSTAIDTPTVPADSLSAIIAGISGFVDTAVWDLAGATFETRRELTAYCDRWAAAMFQVAAAPGLGSEAAHAARSARVAEQFAGESGGVMDARGAISAPDALRFRALGAAVREVELLAGLAREAHAGRLRVPLDELERARVDVSSLAKAPWPAALVNLLRQRHESLRQAIATSVAQFSGDEQASIRGLLVWAKLAWRLSWRAQRALPNVVTPRRYHAVTDGWHAWRAAHRAAAGKLRLN